MTEIEDKDGIPCTDQDVQGVIAIMEKLNRIEGYIDFIGNRLGFFDKEPEEGGKYITLEKLKQSLK